MSSTSPSTYWPSPACPHTRVPWISQSFYIALLGPLDKRNRFHSSAEKKIICFPWSRVWRPRPRGPLGHSPSAPADSLLHPAGSRRTCRPLSGGKIPRPLHSSVCNRREIELRTFLRSYSYCKPFCILSVCLLETPRAASHVSLYGSDTEPTPSRGAWRFMGLSWTNDNNTDSCCCFMESVSQMLIKAK